MLDQLYRNLISTSANMPQIKCITCGAEMVLISCDAAKVKGYDLRTHHCGACGITERFVVQIGAM